MNKKMISGILLSTMVLSNAAVFAAVSELPIVIAPAPAAEEALDGVQTITVNNEAVDFSNANLSQYMFEENGNVMVPVRAVAEKMGFTVGWDGENQAVTVGDVSWEVKAYIGLDNYTGLSKTAIGMTAPQSYGAAPQLIEDTTFVPAKMFELLDYTYQAVGQFVDFEKIGAAEDENNVQIPNPFVPYESLADVKEVLSFDPVVPSVLPADFEQNKITSTGSDFLQIVYTDSSDNRIVYRMAEGSEDISGDYNTYKINKEVKIGDLIVTMRGNDKISNAVWVNGEFAFSVSFDVEIEETEVTNLIENIK